MSTKPKAPARAAKPVASTSPARRKAPAASGASTTRSDAVSLKPIIDVIRKRLPKARHAEGEAFSQAFYKRMGEDELPKHTPEGWAAPASGFLDFARTSQTVTSQASRFYLTYASYH